MKKIRNILFTLVCLLVAPLAYSAESLSMTITCPKTATVGKTIACTIKADNGAANEIIGYEGKFDFDGATYKSNTIAANKAFATPNTVTETGFVLGNTSGFAKNLTLGTVTVLIPAGTNPGTEFRIGVKNIKGSTKTYSDVPAADTYATVRVPETDNTLSTLTVSEGELSPAFAASITKYTVTVDSTVTSITIAATANEGHATVKGTGTKTLAYGENSFTITVTSESGAAKKYTVVVTRTDNRDKTNTLKSLSVKGMSMKPAFDEKTTEYTLNVDATVKKVTIEAALKSDKSSFVKNFGPRDVNLEYGENKILIKVKAENEQVKTYTITITRKDDRNTNNNLKTLTVSVGSLEFDPATTTYTITVPKGTTSIKVDAEVEDEKAKFVKNYGPRTVKISKDETKILIKVQAENEKEKVYTIIVRKDGATSSNTNISSITLSAGNITIEPGKTSYDVEVDASVNEFNINITPEDPNTKVKVEGPKTLQKGMNKYTITITAENGDKVVYTINVNKTDVVLSSNTNISTVTVSGNPVAFDETANAYVVKVDQTSALDLQVTLEDTNSTYQVSGNENLTNGSIIRITVIAQNGASKEYQVKVEFNGAGTPTTPDTPNGGNDMMLYIGIGAVLLLVIIVIAVVVSKKKKGGKTETPATTTEAPAAPAADATPVVEAAPAVEPAPVEAPAAPVETPTVVETPTEEVVTPVVETPAVEVAATPVVETPAVETPAVETPVAEVPTAVATPVAQTTQE